MGVEDKELKLKQDSEERERNQLTQMTRNFFQYYEIWTKENYLVEKRKH